MKILEPHADKIITWGMSCVGKTTFARLVPHTVYTFDFHFPWHSIEGLGLSIEMALRHVADKATSSNQLIIDGWHLADPAGQFMPVGSTIYVIYAPYDQIISQYRVPVNDPKEHLHMFHKWYRAKYREGTRYFRNDGDFVETTKEEYVTFLKHSQ